MYKFMGIGIMINRVNIIREDACIDIPSFIF